MINNKKIFIIIIFIILIAILSIFIYRENIISTVQKTEGESFQDINFEIYYNKNNILKILVTAIDTENGIKTLTYEKEDGNKVELNGNGKHKIAIDYQVEKDGEYEFKFINGAGEEISKVLNINDKYRRNFVNLNLVNRNKFEADGWEEWTNCIPENAIDDSMNYGKGYNWYGGTKLLIEYNTLSTITHIGVYTTGSWGYPIDIATIYYSEDDSLTLDSDLNNYKSVTVKTENIQKLTEKIQAKRIMLTKYERESVYEFQCFGNSNIDTE